jgi:hypothetical protein
MHLVSMDMTTYVVSGGVATYVVGKYNTTYVVSRDVQRTLYLIVLGSNVRCMSPPLIVSRGVQDRVTVSQDFRPLPGGVVGKGTLSGSLTATRR